MISSYIKIARPDHWFKNIFIVPGVALAMIIPQRDFDVEWGCVVRLVAACLIASANYTINEFLDAEFDRHHPVKKNRPSVIGDIKGQYVVLQYILLSVVGLYLASTVGTIFAIVAALLLLMGIVYNVEPIRTKDKPFLDVLSESVNNPLRLLLGWHSVHFSLFPPSSILISYWMGGAFLMAVKRFAEYREIGDPEVAAAYRKSFKYYTENSILLSSFFYALTASLFLGIFLIKYRIELILTFPMFALLFVWYLRIGLREDSQAQAPEKLYQEKKFVAYVIVLTVTILALFFVDFPWLQILLDPIDAR